MPEINRPIHGVDIECNSEWLIELNLHVAITGRLPIKIGNEKQRIYIAQDFHNPNFPPEQAQEIIDVPRYCRDFNVTMPLLIKEGLLDKWISLVKLNEASPSDESIHLVVAAATLLEHLRREPKNF